MARVHGAAFLEKHGGHLSSNQRRALRDLAVCRTKALGGHVERCDGCGQERNAYNSCRNRHCPKCQGGARAQWLAREATHLLPVDYYHVVFTLPAAVAELALANRRELYGLLFQAARATLLELAADPHYLGAQPGLLMVLHTWGQNLHHHPHVHVVATGGGLSCDVRGVVEAAPRWVSCRPGFFLPRTVLSRLFRGKYLAGLRALFDRNQLLFTGKRSALVERSAFAAWLTPLYQQDWVVYAKAPFGGPEQVLKYLARYTHRVAISNSRMIGLDDGRVTFRYKDYADDARQKTMTLSAEEFLRRFLMHVLPKGFVKIRHYGLLANRKRAGFLQICRKLLVAVAAALALGTPSATGPEPTVTVGPQQGSTCPTCGVGRWQRVQRILREATAWPWPWDSS